MKMIILYIHILTTILNMVYLKMSLVAIIKRAKSEMILSVIKFLYQYTTETTRPATNTMHTCP